MRQYIFSSALDFALFLCDTNYNLESLLLYEMKKLLIILVMHVSNIIHSVFATRHAITARPCGQTDRHVAVLLPSRLIALIGY